VPAANRLDHYGVESADIEGEVAFQQEVLGMTLMRWGTHALTGLRIAMLHDGRASKLEVIEVAAVNRALEHTAYATDDLPADYERALAGGATADRPPFRLEPALADSAFVRSRAGLLIQLICYDQDSPDRRPWG
jgi:hypothetical protein